MMIKKGGGYKSQMSDYPPWNCIGTSQLTEDPSGGVNSDGRSSGSSFERSVYNRTSRLGVVTRRDPIHFDAGDERNGPKSI